MWQAIIVTINLIALGFFFKSLLFPTQQQTNSIPPSEIEKMVKEEIKRREHK